MTKSKSYYSKNKRKRNFLTTIKWIKVKSILITLVVISFVLLCLVLYKNSIWQKKGYLSLALQYNDHLGYLIINPKLDELKLLLFPDDLLIDFTYGYSEYRASKFKALVDQEKLNAGEFLKSSMTQYLGNLTTGYMVELNNKGIDIEAFIIQALFDQNKTNLSRLDLIKLLIYIKNLRSEQIEIIDLLNTEILDKQLLPDNRQVYTINFEAFDVFVLKYLANPDFLQEKSTWEIYNATKYAGLGERMRRIITNSGFDVVGLHQANTTLDRTQIEINESLSSNQNILNFSKYFGFQIKNGHSISSRADVVIIIGEDFWEKYHQ